MQAVDRDRKAPPLGAEQLFEALNEAADSAGIGVCVSASSLSDPQRVHLLYANTGLTTILGHSLEEIEARTIWGFFPDDEATRLFALHQAQLEGGSGPSAFETKIVRADGLLVPVDVATSRVLLDQEQLNVTFLFDATHRKNAEEALSRSDARFRALVERAPDGVAILRWPAILYCNPAAARMLGFTGVEEAVGVNLLTKLSVSDAQTANDRITRRQRGKQLEPIEYSSRDIDGIDRTVEIVSMPIEYDGGPAVLAFARDVTERNEMQAQLMAADKLAAVGTLTAGVAHEINNPLAYVLLNVEFLIRELPKLVGDGSRLETLTKRLLETKQGAERVKTIVRDLQTFTRRDEGIKGPVDLQAAIEAALHMARHEIRHRATVIKRFETVPSAHGNATRFEQLFLNLLINAAHAVENNAADKNVIEVAVGASADEMIEATVRDNGAGMSEEVRKRVFDPFFTTKPTGRGTGLGLPICQGIVRAVGGEIRIDSKPGEGTSVTVTLRPHGGTPPRPRAPTPGAFTAVGPRARILVIDDERAVGESLALALSEAHDVVVVISAAEARIRIAAGERYHVVLCDLVMPNETGMTLFDDVRKSHPELARRFAFMTGGAFLPETERFLQAVDNARVEKPFDMKTVRALVERMLRMD